MDRKTTETAKWDNLKFSFSQKVIKRKTGRYNIEITWGDFCDFIDNPSNYPHSHDFYETCLILKGCGKYRIDSQEYNLSEGAVIMADPGSIHEMSSYETGDLQILYLSFKIRDSMFSAREKAEEQLLNLFLNYHSFYCNVSQALLTMIPLLREDIYSNIFSPYQSNEIQFRFVLEIIASLASDSLNFMQKKDI